MKQILPGLYSLSGMRAGRVYLIDDPDGLTLIDASLGSSAPAILKQVAETGKTLKRILITHGHPDHIGGLPQVQKVSGAPVITSEIERPFVEGTAAIERSPSRIPMPQQTMPGTPVARAVREGEVITEAFGGLHVIASPGHTRGHIAFWQPEKRVLFAGDTMMHLAGLRLPFALFTVDMDEDKR
ncbi:MAG: MBL fold metallo-hydrolase, partial [Anaerolineae bacterium]|nr:MBL fold metallo-hydrolase [Anaerolineae bacterium]